MTGARAFATLTSTAALALAAGCATVDDAAEPEPFADVEITTHQLADGLYYLEGAGGNIAVSVGEDGVFLVDDQFAPLSEKIMDAVAELSDEPVSFILNTHHHGDHVGGNANFGAAGAIIVSHENARPRIAGNFTNPFGDAEPQPVPAHALPIVTFSDDVTFHFNGETIHVFHVDPAHTDGDSMVHFQNADVIHTGDVFRTTSYPAADVNGGGDFFGILAAYERVKGMMEADTRLLPGHGAVSGVDAIDSQLAMIETIRARVADAKAGGATLEEVLAAGPSAEFDERWGQGRWTGEYLVTTLYDAID